MQETELTLERKFCAAGADAPLALEGEARVAGYASLFGRPDQGGDIVSKGAFAAALAAGRGVKMLWQHDPAQPIGVWEEITEDGRGLRVRGRLLSEVARGREAAALIAAGAIDGLSIGYRTKRAERDETGRRVLTEIELWEVSLVTFPMLAEARLGAKAEEPAAAALRGMAAALRDARRQLEGARAGRGTERGVERE